MILAVIFYLEADFFLIGTVLNNVLLQKTLEELSGLWNQELFMLDPLCINLKKSTAP